jgi:L-histidine N-alpha-methyltransferase
MTTVTIESHLADGYIGAALRDDVIAGFGGVPKRLRPLWFYDARGSELFEQITRLPEYYLTRAEWEILVGQAAAIAAVSRADTLVELGSGSSVKTRLLLDALAATGQVARYVPVDVSEAALRSAVDAIRVERPGLAIHAVVADIGTHLDSVPLGDRCLVAFLGSTVGNLEPEERAKFLSRLAGLLRPGDTLLLGTDLVKDPALLVAAYDDAAGVTAEFNRNVLRVLNRELGADFDPEAFSHVAQWNAASEWIEMRLRSRRRQVVQLPGADLVVSFQPGEEIWTEVSAKFRAGGVREELARAGFTTLRWWTDRAEQFGLSLSVRDERPST